MSDKPMIIWEGDIGYTTYRITGTIITELLPLIGNVSNRVYFFEELDGCDSLGCQRWITLPDTSINPQWLKLCVNAEIQEIMLDVIKKVRTYKKSTDDKLK